MWPVVSGIVAAAITAIVTVYLGKRSKSGKIETSEAKDLWDTLRAELARLQTETTELRAELTVVRLEMATLREEASKVRTYVQSLQEDLVIAHQDAQNLRDAAKSTGKRKSKAKAKSR